MSNVALFQQNEVSIDKNTIDVLKETLYPGAKDSSIEMVVNYCKARNLNPLLKPVHLVPMNVKTGRKGSDGKDVYEWRDVVMPGIAQYRIDAARSGQYAGMEEPVFGEDVTEKIGSTTITYPKWCKVTVKKLLNDKIVEFSAKEYWKENYASKSRNDSTPNAMWEKRAYGQIAKCAEAQALRKAFPDIVGQEYTKEEMEGKNFKNEYANSRVIEGEKVTKHLESRDLNNDLNDIGWSQTLTELEDKFKESYKHFIQLRDQDAIKQIIEAKDKRKSEIEKDIKEELDKADAEL